MPKVVHFEIHAQDPEKLVRFYTDALGWSFSKWEGPVEYWLISTGGKDELGIDGGLMKREGPPPQPGSPVTSFVCIVEVDNIDTYLERAQSAGGLVVVEKMPVPGVGWSAYILDPDGNIFGLHQEDPSVT